ncbi:MAG TPA: hypothetical protein VGD78_22955 [Chthoniobacterales bacterium]
MAEANPHRILKILDRNLAHSAELTLFGRAALALGFGQALPEWGESLDVDIIVASHLSATLDQDDQFWAAIEATNGQLASSGLYVAHIFDEEQLIIRPDWYVQKQRIHLRDLGKITLYRPATLDLILTKMARADDPEDRRDVLTMIALDRLSPHAVRQAIAAARVPDLPDVVEQFRRAKAFIEEQLANQPEAPGP